MGVSILNVVNFWRNAREFSTCFSRGSLGWIFDDLLILEHEKSPGLDRSRAFEDLFSLSEELVALEDPERDEESGKDGDDKSEKWDGDRVDDNHQRSEEGEDLKDDRGEHSEMEAIVLDLEALPSGFVGTASRESASPLHND